MDYKILILDNKAKKFYTFVYTNEESYKLMFKRFLKWEKQGKLTIIPQDINKFIETGDKR